MRLVSIAVGLTLLTAPGAPVTTPDALSVAAPPSSSPNLKVRRSWAQAQRSSAQAQRRVTDLRGRTVTIPSPARRLLIDDGRYLIALSLIHPDPVSVLTAWPKDINRIGAQTFERYRQKFPRIEQLTQVASSAGTFSLEHVIAAKPDVAIFTLGLGPNDQEIRTLEATGIQVVFLDFFSHPFTNLAPSLRVLGEIAGREKEAAAFVTFREQRIQRIATAAAKVTTRPKVFLEAHAGMSDDCCNSPGKGNVGDYISFVGGHNIGADVLPGTFGKLNAEYVIAQDPAVYIATGGPHLEKTGGLVVGPGYTAERARASLTRVAARPVISRLAAVRNGRVYGLSHQLLNSPLDLLAIEALARWIQPGVFGDVDPDATVRELNRFLAVPLEGAHWISLR